jgi:ParB/RepB/Spo0J family partition protein
MSSKEKGKERPRLISVKPAEIKIPDVRVTSSWDPELLAMFRDSIKAMGIVEPIVAVEEKGELWLVDGLHRLEEAQKQNLSKVQAVALPGTLRDVYVKNLMLNRLRGKTKVSEMVLVVKHLENEFQMDMDTIAKETGLKRDYVEKMMVIGRVRPEVLADLDAERIHVGHAYEIGRVEDQDVQLRLLLQCKQYDLTVSDLRDIVDSTLQILAERKASPQSPPGPMPIPPATIKCHFCDLERPVREVRGFNLCQTCFAIGYETVQQRKAASGLPPTEQKEDEE